MKACVKCGADKPAAEFAKRASAKDGRASYCKPCHSEYYRAWRAENVDACRAEKRRYYKRHREQKLAYLATWRANNKARHRAMVLDWEQRNPDRVAAKYARYRDRHPEQFKRWQDERRDSGRRRLSNWVRRALERASNIRGARLTVDAVIARFALYGWRCRYCGTALTMATAQGDHRIPLSRGGRNCAANIVPACGSCNRRKHTKTEREFLATHVA